MQACTIKNAHKRAEARHTGTCCWLFFEYFEPSLLLQVLRVHLFVLTVAKVEKVEMFYMVFHYIIYCE